MKLEKELDPIVAELHNRFGKLMGIFPGPKEKGVQWLYISALDTSDESRKEAMELARLVKQRLPKLKFAVKWAQTTGAGMKRDTAMFPTFPPDKLIEIKSEEYS